MYWQRSMVFFHNKNFLSMGFFYDKFLYSLAPQQFTTEGPEAKQPDSEDGQDQP